MQLDLKKIAHNIVAYALRRGDIVRPERCEWCGRRAYVVAHHKDYHFPLDVQWICYRCNNRHSASRRRGMKYRKREKRGTAHKYQSKI